jgi:hypothetical protein
MWLAILSDQLPVVALVGRYPANKLIGREPLHRRNLAAAFLAQGCPRTIVRGINRPLGRLSPTDGQVSHVLRTRLPLNWRVAPPVPFDLHVLGTPPAFVLSQDQTLQ